MIETTLAFLAGWLLSWPALIIMLILGSVFEANESHGWAIFIGLVAAVSAYFFFAIPFTVLLMYSVGYFVVGFVWSYWRYKRHADQVVDEYKSRDKAARDNAIHYLHPTKMLDKITTWVIVWPFSMFESVLGDIVQLVQIAITKFFKGIYTRIFNNAVSQLTSNE